MTAFPDVTHLLFGHDGVLVDTEFWYFSAVRDELAASGVELSFDGYLRDRPSGLASYVAQLPAEQQGGFRDRRDKRYHDTLSYADIQIPGVENALATLKGHYSMGVVATASRTGFDAIHEHRNLTMYFDAVVTRDDYEGPAEARYQIALDRLGVEAEQVLVIEASADGVSAATAAGIACVVVHNDFDTVGDRSGASARIGNLTELPALLGRRMPGIHSD